MSDYIDAVFGSQGALARKFSGYQPREGQIAMARAVDRAISSSGHLLVEAPTGTGKSISYAVPAIHHAQQLGAAAIIVTANIALQEQLVRKDLPLLCEVLPEHFRYALLKGKSNYLCLEKYYNGTPGTVDLDDIEMNERIAAWAEETENGDMSELPFTPSPKLWSRYSVSSEECLGKDCEFYNNCHSQNAREQAAIAEVVVTNYHLFFADMHVREMTEGMVSLLPDYAIAILDEGHKAVEIARDFFGFRITEGMLRSVASLLDYNEKLMLEVAFSEFFVALGMYKRNPKYKSRIREKDCVPFAKLDAALDAATQNYAAMLGALLADYQSLSITERKRVRKLAARYTRAKELREEIAAVMSLDVGENDSVYFIEDDNGRIALCSKPVHVAEMLRDRLFNVTSSVSVTSATLAARGSFEYIAKDLGAEAAQTLIAPSPFSWHDQALLITPQDLPEPSDPKFVLEAARKFAQTIELARGRTLGLFTSYKGLNAAHERAVRTGYRILRQGDMPRTQLIEEFKRDVNSVLLGVESFWAGVDVPGESLSCVFIDKLPFTTPDDPVMDALTERNKDWFMKYSVPRAIISFKQGFGRLIRTTTDKGVVVLCDRRVTTKFYGKHFIDSLPQVQRSSNIDDVRRFLDGESIIGVASVTGTSMTTRSLFDL
jgi:ATP-dependent DNA helicase DinG